MKREPVSEESRELSWLKRKIKPLKARRLAKRVVGYVKERKNDAKMREYPRMLIITNRPRN
jgi:ATP-dependent protease HslVU (ClpYQ) peptidase subunit